MLTGYGRNGPTLAMDRTRCVLSFLSEITAANIAHLRNGRPPNAGAAIFPSIPILPLLFIGAAWLLRMLIPEYATWVLVAAFLALSSLWVFSFAQLRAEFHRTKKASHT